MSLELDPVVTPDQRQKDRLPVRYAAASATEITFDQRLAFEIALQMEPPAEVLARYGYSADEAVLLIGHDVFKKAVALHLVDIKENGITFRTKARMQAEDLLEHAYEMATDPQMPPAVRADLIKWHGKVADLEPRESKNAVQGGGFSLQIVLAGAPGGAPHQPNLPPQTITINQLTETPE